MAVGLMVPRRGGVVEVGGPGFSRGLSRLQRFRKDIYGCFSRRADALFELGDALLCAAGPVISPVELSVEPEFGRGHGSVYDALHAGRIDTSRLRRVLTGVLTPPRAGEPLMFGIDLSPLPRPAARYADGLSMVAVRAVGGNQFVPGWPVSILVGLGWGGSSWVEPVEARRITPGQDHAAVALGQVRALIQDLRASGGLTERDVPPLVMFDSGYPATDLAYALAEAPVQVLVRVRSDRVFYGAPGPRHPRGGRTPMHGARLACNDPSTWRAPDVSLTADSARYGRVRVSAWHAMHQALQRIAGFAHFPADQDLPVVPGTLIHVQAEKLPHGGPVKPLWLWHAAPPGHEPDIDLLWKAYLRRFDQEHFHRFAKVYLGLDAARLLSPRGDRPVDRPDHGRVRATAPRRRPGRRPAQALAQGHSARGVTHTLSDTSRVSPPTRQAGNTRRHGETHHSRPRPSTRTQKPAQDTDSGLPLTRQTPRAHPARRQTPTITKQEQQTPDST